MRKKKRQLSGKQLNLFEIRPVSFRPNSKDGGTESAESGESYFFSLLTRNRAFTTTLLDEIMSPKNLSDAYQAVKRNKGSSGVDSMDVYELKDWLGIHTPALIAQVLEETYTPSAVLGVKIPKPNGGTRQLGIPTVLDRLIQQAIHQKLNALYDPLFSEHSYGFRPNRSALQAVTQASEYISQGYGWVVDIDLKSFFDKINHDRLMQRLSKGIGDKRLLRLIRKYLRSGMLEGGLSQQR